MKNVIGVTAQFVGQTEFPGIGDYLEDTVCTRLMTLHIPRNEVENQRRGLEEFLLAIRRRIAPRFPGGLPNGAATWPPDHS